MISNLLTFFDVKWAVYSFQSMCIQYFAVLTYFLCYLLPGSAQRNSSCFIFLVIHKSMVRFARPLSLKITQFAVHVHYISFFLQYKSKQ